MNSVENSYFYSLLFFFGNYASIELIWITRNFMRSILCKTEFCSWRWIQSQQGRQYFIVFWRDQVPYMLSSSWKCLYWFSTDTNDTDTVPSLVHWSPSSSSPESEKLTCRYLSWIADGDCEIISAASLRAWLAFCSPSAAMTLNMANR